MLYLEDLKLVIVLSVVSMKLHLMKLNNLQATMTPQPFHTDEELAKEDPIFKGIAASGWHTSAITMRLWTECMPIHGGLVGSESSLRWPRPTRPGDRIHVEAEISAITPSKTKLDRGIVATLRKP